MIAAIPVSIDLEKARTCNVCDLNINFSWGMLKSLSDNQKIQIKWFSFKDYIGKFNRNKHEFLKIFINSSIDFSENEKGLFQGREEEINLVISRFIDSRDFHPIYFHGTRKVGKTSLLRKIELELKNRDFKPIYIDLNQSNPSAKPVGEIVKMIVEQMIKGAVKQEILEPQFNLSEIDMVTDPLNAFEKIIDKLYSNNGNKRIILLLDEFQLIVHPNTSELLDMFRRLNNSGVLAFILTGLYRPEIIRSQSNSQFSFLHHSVDFLKYDAIKKFLTEPVSDLGITFHEGAIGAVYKLTAGNPFHASMIAQGCIDILNVEHRNMVVETDIDKVSLILSSDEYIFSVSTFTSLVLTPPEKTTAKNIAKEIMDNEEGISLERVKTIASIELLTSLQQKYIIETTSNKIKNTGELFVDASRKNQI